MEAGLKQTVALAVYNAAGGQGFDGGDLSEYATSSKVVPAR
jgi:hypothetical protein